MLSNLINKVKQDGYKFNDSKFRNFVMPAQIITTESCTYCLIFINYSKIYMMFDELYRHIINRSIIMELIT